MDRPADFDDARAAVTSRGHLARVSDWMTPTVASHLEFHELVPYKTLLKRLFSRAPWSDADDDRLNDLVGPNLVGAWWDELRFEDGIVVGHGMRDGRYAIEARGAADASPDIFDRVFDGPVVPEATPHPRKVKFDIGGDPAPGTWYRRGETTGDDRVERLFAEGDVTDVMVAGDFVTIGLDRSSRWEDRLDDLLGLVTELFPHGARAGGARSRDELVAEGRSLPVDAGGELHLLDPDHPANTSRLGAALTDTDPRVRRIAVAVLAESTDLARAEAAIRTGWSDRSRVVRRTAVDVAADLADERLRDVFEDALAAEDPWIRWRAVRALGDVGVGPSRGPVAALSDDGDFQVRFEVARVLRDTAE